MISTGSKNANGRFGFRKLLYALGLNTVIALFLTGIKFGDGFVVNFIFSQCIGISICVSIVAALSLTKNTRVFTQLGIIMIAMCIGALFGIIMGSFATGKGFSTFFRDNYDFFIQVLLFSFLFGSIISYIFISRERIAATEVLIQEERIKRLTSEKQIAEINLRLLQAQIEPHFLFNTLSNILSLLDTEIEKGKSMLIDFTHYLRTSLTRTRDEITTIGQEAEMNRIYLTIFKARMGDRLHFEIDIPENMKSIPFPPMLVQPLVENAIKHGLEPAIGGGKIWIRGALEGGTIRLEVLDTGLGLRENSPAGIGLDNIRERLRSLYGEEGRLILEENRPSGLKAIIEVPYEKNQGSHSR